MSGSSINSGKLRCFAGAGNKFGLRATLINPKGKPLDGLRARLGNIFSKKVLRNLGGRPLMESEPLSRRIMSTAPATSASASTSTSAAEPGGARASLFQARTDTAVMQSDRQDPGEDFAQGQATGGGEVPWTLEEVQAEYGAALLAFAISLLRNDRERARDVVQDVFLKLHRHGPDGVAPARLKSWLYTVCRNRAIDILRKEKPMTTTDSAQLHSVRDHRPDPSVQAEQREQRAEVLGLVDRLPDNQREVVRLKFQSDLSYREIADVTQLSVSNVGFLLHNALKNLRQMAAALPQ